MKILISPAKSLDFKKPLPVSEFTTPVFIQEAAQINELLKKENSERTAKFDVYFRKAG
jgi:cytoplasmic iron level regulating protein YaaA (DUF328/UPF0246 family)